MKHRRRPPRHESRAAEASGGGRLTLDEVKAASDSLEQAGILESFVRADGQVARRLTELGRRIAELDSMGFSAEARAIFDDLTEPSEATPRGGRREA